MTNHESCHDKKKINTISYIELSYKYTFNCSYLLRNIAFRGSCCLEAEFGDWGGANGDDGDWESCIGLFGWINFDLFGDCCCCWDDDGDDDDADLPLLFIKISIVVS